MKRIIGWIAFFAGLIALVVKTCLLFLYDVRSSNDFLLNVLFFGVIASGFYLTRSDKKRPQKETQRISKTEKEELKEFKDEDHSRYMPK